MNRLPGLRFGIVDTIRTSNVTLLIAAGGQRSSF